MTERLNSEFLRLSEAEQREVAARVLKIEQAGWKPFWCPDKSCNGDPHWMQDPDGDAVFVPVGSRWDKEGVGPMGAPLDADYREGYVDEDGTNWGIPVLDPQWAHNHARKDQRLPGWSKPWILFIMSGRGAGKTTTGVEFVTLSARKGLDGAILGRRGTELVNTHVATIIARAHPDFVPVHWASKDILEWPNGAITYLFSAEKPENIRSVNLSYCHPEGTLVQTALGEAPIENVRAGDQVWTRDGLASVRAVAERESAYVEIVHEGGVLRITPEHPVWTEHGWLEARFVQPGDRLAVWTNTFTRSPLASSGDSTRTPDASSDKDQAAQSDGLGTFTPTGLGHRPQGMRSTTSTETRRTTDPTTSSLSASETTGDSTRLSHSLGYAGTAVLPSSVSATGRCASPAERSRTSSTSAQRKRGASQFVPVESVEPTSSLALANSALSGASTSGGSHQPPNESAPTVASNSSGSRPLPGALSASERTSTGDSESAVPVLAWSQVTEVVEHTSTTVHSLSVSGNAPEFFADDVLVHNCWVDEAAFMDEIKTAWMNLKLATRIESPGNPIHFLITSTPTPTQWVMDMEDDPDVEVRRVSTYANRANLSKSFLTDLEKNFEGTRMGRQELHGEVLRDVEGAYWNDDLFRHWRVKAEDFAGVLESMDDRVVAVDPAGSKGPRSDATGIIGAGVQHTDADGQPLYSSRYFVLADATIKGSPSEWAAQVFKAARLLRANRIVAEKNFGGDMVKQVLDNYAEMHPEETSDENGEPFRIEVVHAAQSKETRAEGTVARYEQGLVEHVTSPTLFGDLSELEKEQIGWVPKSRGGRMPSPNRIDALVWAFRALATAVKHKATTADRRTVMNNLRRLKGRDNTL